MVAFSSYLQPACCSFGLTARPPPGRRPGDASRAALNWAFKVSKGTEQFLQCSQASPLLIFLFLPLSLRGPSWPSWPSWPLAPSFPARCPVRRGSKAHGGKRWRTPLLGTCSVHIASQRKPKPQQRQNTSHPRRVPAESRVAPQWVPPCPTPDPVLHAL